MKNDYVVLAATYGKLKSILKVPEPTRRQQMSMCHAYPPIIPFDDTEVLVLLDKNNQRVVLSLGPTFEAEEVDIEKLLNLPVYGGEYTVMHSAFHGLTIERGIRSADHSFGSPLQQPMMPQFSPMVSPRMNQVQMQQFSPAAAYSPIPAAFTITNFQDSRPEILAENRKKLLTDYFERMKAQENDPEEEHEPVFLEEVLDAGSVFGHEGVLLMTEYGGLCHLNQQGELTYYKYDVHAKRFHTVWQ